MKTCTEAYTSTRVKEEMDKLIARGMEMVKNHPNLKDGKCTTCGSPWMLETLPGDKVRISCWKGCW